MTFAIAPGPLDSALEQAYSRLTASRFAEALWTRRLDVWSGDAAIRQKIATRLGWLGAPEWVAPHLPRLRTFAHSIAASGFTDIVLLGMGGSSLAPEVLRRIAGSAPGYPRFHVLDSVDPDAVHAALERADTSLFILASKSGTTIEPNAIAAAVVQRLQAASAAEVGSRFVAITDEGTALHRRAVDERFRELFLNPADIGGRYSALSFFGLVPAALMGIDIDALLASAQAMASACQAHDPRSNPALALGATIAAAASTGRDKLTLLTAPVWEPFGVWVEQLVAESTGKQGKGVVPVVGEAADAFGDDRLLVVMTVAGDQDARSSQSAGHSHVPTVTLQVPDTAALGAEFFRWEAATATAGFLMEINPFDEPNVQQAKDATAALLDAFRTRLRLPVPEPHAMVERVRATLTAGAQQALAGGDPMTFLRVIRRHDYFALLAYLPPDNEALEAILRDARHAIGRRACCAATLGYGPRYLHSTGQLHKGGANTGVFLMVTAEAPDDLAVPGEPFSFGTLETAQALGDFQSLDRAGRRGLHLHLPDRDRSLLRRTFERLLQAL